VITLGYLFYNSVIFILALCAVPFSFLKILCSKGTLHGERWGVYAPAFLRERGQRPTIWLHAASVGEVRVALLLLPQVKKAYPRHRFVISTTTTQGRAVAARAEGVDAAFLAPLDLPLIVRRAMKRINPCLLLVAETELWPNLLKEVKRNGIPLILFNGRISRKSFRFYLPLRFFFGGVVRNFDALCLKSDVDKERMTRLGAPPQTIRVTGDIKFHHATPVVATRSKQVRRQLRLPADVPVLIAGSTHEGEEDLAIEIFKKLRAEFPRLMMILAPRHVQRVLRVEGLLKVRGVRWVKRTMINDNRRPEEVIVLDTIGELTAVYEVGTAIFVGGSFSKVGGHNIVEVLALGKAVIFGPHVESIRDVARLAVEWGAGIQVQTPDEFEEAVRRLLHDSRLREGMGRRGLAFVRNQQGAVEKTMKVIKAWYKG
jgi:3-deoxy-D-manno-octulosonic-acid transferase